MTKIEVANLVTRKGGNLVTIEGIEENHLVTKIEVDNLVTSGGIEASNLVTSTKSLLQPARDFTLGYTGANQLFSYTQLLNCSSTQVNSLNWISNQFCWNKKLEKHRKYKYKSSVNENIYSVVSGSKKIAAVGINGCVILCHPSCNLTIAQFSNCSLP